MKVTHDQIFTPIYLKLADDMPWPEHEKVFHLLSRDGLFICRNHPFFRSSAPARVWPGELASHEASLRLSYPKIPQRMFERIIGFFDRIGRRHGAEAIVLIAWNTRTQALELIVPEQTSIVSSTWSVRPYPIEVHYEAPPLPPHLMIIADIHSHVDEAPYASPTDKADESHRSGLHLVVGRLLSQDPPAVHIEACIDGARFKINDLATVVEGYERRRPHEVPPAWEATVKVTTWSGYYKTASINGSATETGGFSDRSVTRVPQNPDSETSRKEQP